MYFSIFLCVSKDEIEQSDHHCILFGESMSKITRKEKMDIFVRFWSKSTNDVDIMDFKSLFLGHTIVNDLLDTFKTSQANIDTDKIFQVTVDGPSVNWKFYELLSSEETSEIYRYQKLWSSCAQFSI